MIKFHFNINKNIVQKLFWVIVIFVTLWGSYLPGINFGIVNMFPMRILCLLCIFVYSIKHRIKFLVKRENLYLMFLFFYGVITLIWTKDIGTSLSSLITFIFNIFLFYIAQSTMKDSTIYDITFAFRINTYIICIMALFEAFNGYIYGATYLWMENSKNIFGLYFPRTIFYNTNNLSVYLSLLLPIGTLLPNNKEYNIIKYFYIGISAFFIILTGSRAGVLSVAVYVFCNYFLYGKGSNGKIKIVLIIFISVAVIAYYQKEIINLLTDNGRNVNLANEGRWKIWKTIFQIAKQYYFIGTGPGMSSELFYPPHNIWLEILCEFGIVGFIFFIMFIYRIFVYKNSKINNNIKHIYIIYFILFLVNSICQSSLQQANYIWIIFGILSKYKTLELENRK